MRKQRPASAAAGGRISSGWTSSHCSVAAGQLALSKQRERPSTALSTIDRQISKVRQTRCRSPISGSPVKQRPMSAQESAPIALRRLRLLDEDYSKKFATAKREVKLLNLDIKKAKMRIAAHRRELGRSGSWKDNEARVSRHKVTLENRLQKSTTKANTCKHRNKQLKEDIDELRKGQMNLRRKQGKMQKAVADYQKEHQEVNVGLHEARHEIKHLDHQMKRMKHETQAAGHTFVAAYTSDETETKKTDMDEYKRIKNSMDAVGEGVLDKKQEKKLVFENMRSKWKQAEKKATSGNIQERLESYAQAFVKIQQQTGVKDLDDLVAKYSVIKERQYDVLLRVNALDVEKQQAEDKVSRTITHS